jgi:hypothetical protein
LLHYMTVDVGAIAKPRDELRQSVLPPQRLWNAKFHLWPTLTRNTDFNTTMTVLRLLHLYYDRLETRGETWG